MRWELSRVKRVRRGVWVIPGLLQAAYDFGICLKVLFRPYFFLFRSRVTRTFRRRVSTLEVAVNE